MFLFEQDEKLWFCTNSTKDVYKDMQVNPEIEVSVSILADWRETPVSVLRQMKEKTIKEKIK